MTDIFNILLINPIINLLVAIYQLLVFLSIPFALGFSIILLTILVRFIIYPLTNAQLRSMQNMQKLKPHMDKIKEKYKNDKARQQRETLELYRQHNINPAAGCLPVIIQLPIFIGLYNVFFKIVNANGDGAIGNINQVLYFKGLALGKIWDPNFFGVSLAATPASSWQGVPVLILVPLITGVLQFIQSKMMIQKEEKKAVPAKEQKDDFQKVMQTQMTYLMPIMIGFFSFTFPVGLSLYWNTYTVFGIVQQYLLTKKQHEKRENS